MLLLRANTDILRAVTGSAADIEVNRSVIVADNAAPPAIQAIPDLGPMASITTATTTTVVDTTGGTDEHSWNVKDLSFFNNHASQSTTLRVEVNDGTNTVVLWNGTLLAGECLKLNEVGDWVLYDATGNVKPGTFPAASQTEQEAGASNTVSATPANQHWHPSSLKCWGKANGAGTTLHVNYNTSGITDTATGRLGVTIGTDFSSVHYPAVCSIERDQTSLAEANVAQCEIRNASLAAGSFEIESYDHTATTLAAQDPSSYSWLCAGDL
jgi:hypothetical protein